MLQFVLLEAPSNLGLIEPFPGVEPGVKFFPSAMELAGFYSVIPVKKKFRVEALPYSMYVDPESKVRNAEKIIDYSIKLASAIDEQIQKEDRSIVIGGDCSILIGAAISLKRNGDYGLFFLDGHTDYVLPEQSDTSGAAGMDLAIVTGNGHDKLTNIEGLRPYIKEENVFCAGNRELSADWYIDAIQKSNIDYYDLNALRAKSIPVIVGNFLDMIHSKNLDGFWIHFDVDVLNNNIMPCVDSPQEGGLSYEELKWVLDPLIHSKKFTGIDITIFDPTLDKEEIYAKKLVKNIGEILKGLANKEDSCV